MASNAAEEARLAQLPPERLDHRHQVRDVRPVDYNLIKNWEVVALMVNRSIGSGIFLVPGKVLAGTGCVGGALILWILGALISFSGLHVWLVCAFSMPQFHIEDEEKPRGVPRSGGELNFLQYMYSVAKPHHPHPNLRISCCFGVMFILMYNLSGNAISFAIKILASLGYYNPSDGEVPNRLATLLIAILTLTVVVACHTFSRRGGLWINNGFAVIKSLILIIMIIFGWRYAFGWQGGSGLVAKENYGQGFFESPQSDVSSWSNSLLLCSYAYYGGEQPFYVIAETRSPRKTFYRYIKIGWLITTLLFLGVNFIYFVVVSKNDILPRNPGALPSEIDMATLFFTHIFVKDQDRAAKASAALTAFCIVGNLWVMTFTAARVKQEIAKEGALQPWSIPISIPHRTPWGMFREWYHGRRNKPLNDDEIDRAPLYAFVLHWASSGILVAAVSPIVDPRKSYYVLVSLYSYIMVVVVGVWVCLGMLVIQFRKSTKRWKRGARYYPWHAPIHPIIYGIATAFIGAASFQRPKPDSPFAQSVTGVPYYLIPTIGVTAPFWGFLWYYCVLRTMKPGHTLHVTRDPDPEPDPDNHEEYVQREEFIYQRWNFDRRDRGRGDGQTFQASPAQRVALRVLRPWRHRSNQ